MQTFIISSLIHGSTKFKLRHSVQLLEVVLLCRAGKTYLATIVLPILARANSGGGGWPTCSIDLMRIFSPGSDLITKLGALLAALLLWIEKTRASRFSQSL